VLDCTAVPASLFEAELLGHERGAFTGATSTRKGCFELAHGGTLLIDEIGDLELPLQAKLLRAVETQTVRRVGGDRAMHVDVRILAATRRDLDREVQEGRFRDDLFHRLTVSRVELPPLRRRTGDVRLLGSHFWSELGGAPPGPPEEVLRRWDDHDWPGNVRELRNAVARRIALGELEVTTPSRPSMPPPSFASSAVAPVDPDTLDAILQDSVAKRTPLTEARNRMVRAFERSYLEALATACGGDADRVAATAGIGRRYLNMIRARVRG
jgi:DNA-binding NtrC family response regulator